MTTQIRTLVVDDEAGVRFFLEQTLRQTDHLVVTASSGEEALRALDAAPHDIILLDLLMPEMDGFEVVQRIKANPRWRNIPIIVVTAKDLADSDWGFLHRSVDKIIQKSGLAEESLMKEVQSLLREHDASRKEDRIDEENPGGGRC